VSELPGPGVDASGRLVLDPTPNVIAIIEAAVKRQDDLRLKDAAHFREIIALREAYDEKLRLAETNRIDAIRAVDQGNVTRASEVAAAQATALAAQLQASAEALRVQVEQTRIQTADTLATALQPLQNDVAVLREVQFRQQGEKSGVVERRSTSTDTRALVFGILAFVGVVAAVISPHIK